MPIAETTAVLTAVSAPVDPAAGDADVMASVARFVAAHYAGSLRISDLARHANVSVRTLQNLFHIHCGEPPLKAVRRYRLCRLLESFEARPWAPLRVHLDRCGLAGGLADRDLFLEMYGCTMREWMHACRHNPSSLPADTPASLFPVRANLESYLPRSA